MQLCRGNSFSGYLPPLDKESKLIELSPCLRPRHDGFSVRYNLLLNLSSRVGLSIEVSDMIPRPTVKPTEFRKVAHINDG